MHDLGLHLTPGVPFFTDADHGLRSAEPYAFVHAELPDGWHRTSSSAVWTTVGRDTTLPPAGWKVHVSTVRREAPEVLALVAAACFDLGVSFKHLTSPRAFDALSSKYAPRASSGKFVTVYPVDAAQTDLVVERLGALLRGRHGPAILTDIAVGGAPVHVRHGAYRELWTVLPTGADALAYAGPDGEPVPDPRSLAFAVPGGVEVPRCVAAAREHRRTNARERTLPYSVSQALHVSAGGGVYQATSPDGTEVALKEGRRHAGIGLDGSDAAGRVRHEADTLRSLADVRGVPRVLGWHEFDDRVFMAQEFVDGCRAIEFVAQFHPEVRADATAAEVARYAERVAGIVAALRATVTEIHRRGLAVGDLHPGNLLLGADDTVTLVDLETAHQASAPVEDGYTVAPGFRVRASSPQHADLLRLELVHLWFLTPQNTYWEFSDGVLERCLDEARDRFAPAPGTFAALRAAAGPRTPVVDWGRVDPVRPDLPTTDLIGLAERTLLSFPVRDARCSPVPVGPGAVPWSLANGAAGAIWTVRHASSPRVGELVDWLGAAAGASARTVPGLFDGYAGAAAVLHDCGDPATAHALLDRAVRWSERVTNPDLARGLSGVGLAALRLGDGSGAERLGRRVADLLESGARLGRGLGAGGSGIALFAVRLFEATGDERWLDLATRALARDLRHLVPRPDGTALVDHGTGRMLPDVLSGTLGVAVAARELGRHRTVADGADVRAAALRVCLVTGWATQGLLEGRSGALAFAAATDGECAATAVARQTDALRRYFCHVGEEVHFPGLLGLRFSCDLGSGLAGAVHALRAVTDPAEHLLPLLGPLPAPVPTPIHDERTCHV
ncbi:class III lanthionine synthetase LanKC [Phycicoccus flavus]|uniref:class III lanthionine synthetase LanKC n=1 Tax=Phycicoccus flavus TaxID=2502783 RepID=UPI000FEC09B1|nr:class III lanthionine synthetase LanKC [Phycicoccus flavus]NHA66996.1 protein kinase/lanthionine synthetase C family protein [Phycicoccus flavus]